MSIHALIQKLPKAELHIHIEGSLEPENLLKFARRNKVDIPFETAAQIKDAYKFENLQGFLDIYYQGMAVLQTEQDFFDLTYAYLTRVREDNCRHVEIFFDPQAHVSRGIEFSVVIDGILAALEKGKRELGITSQVIMCFLRHLSEENAFDMLEMSKPYHDKLLGVGLDSLELGHPPSKFEAVFQKARELGLITVAHAGEEGPPSYVTEALDLLKISRLDHGNRALEDKALVARLVKEKMALTVCPLSNLSLKVVEDLIDHPLKQMLDLGLCATVNSDDPSYFGGYLNDNFIAVADALDLSEADIVTLVKNGIEAAYLAPDKKERMLSEVDKIAGETSR